MKRLIPFLSFLTLLLLMGSDLHATHMAGAEITYKCLGGNRYQITLVYYRDCRGVSAPTSQTVFISSASCNRRLSLNVRNTNPGGSGPTEVSASCVRTTCNGGSAPGLHQVVMTGIVTLPKACKDWVFTYGSCCRNFDITSLTSPGSTALQVQSTLNNVDGGCNSSPVFFSPPAPFICVNQPYVYNMGTVDPDGDQLVHVLVSARRTGTNNYTTGPSVTYANGFSATAPLRSNPAMTINSATGQISMNPSQVQVGVIAVKVNEYRNGVLIGSVTRDIQIRVIACTGANNQVPAFATPTNVAGGVLVNSQRIVVCPDDSISFRIIATDPNSNDTLRIIDSISPAGSVFSHTSPATGANPDTAYFGWKPDTGDVGVHPVVFLAIDDACPSRGLQTYVVNIEVSNGVSAGNDQTICSSSSHSALISARGGSNFTWKVLSGDASSLGNPNSPGQRVQPSQTTVYEVTSNLVCNGDSTDTVVVNVVPPFGLSIPPDQAYCGTKTVQLYATPAAAGTYSYSWTPQGAVTNHQISNPMTSPQDTTEYTVTVQDSVSGCVVVDTVKISVSSATLSYSPTVSATTFCTGGDSICLFGNVEVGDCNLYTAKKITYAPVTMSSNATTRTMGDDQLLLPSVSLGFPFIFYCDTFTNIVISSNGWFAFIGTNPTQTYPTPGTLPNTADPKNMVAYAWSDLDPQPTAPGQVKMRTETIGTAPNRKFVLELINVRNAGAGTPVNMQVVLYEGSHDIEFHIGSIQNGSTLMTQGINDKTGQKGLALPGRNTGQWNASNEGWRIAYDKGDPYVVTWHKAPVNNPSSVMGTGDSMCVYPTSNPAVYLMEIGDVAGRCRDTVGLDTVRASSVDAGANQTILIGGTANLNGSYTGPQTSVCTTYAVSQIPYAPLTGSATNVPGGALSCVGGTLGDDDVSSAVNIGFSFRFFCNTYTQLYVADNGWVGFNNPGATPNAHPTPTTLGNSGGPDNFIAVAWSDLVPCAAFGGGGTVDYFTTGTAPNRKFVLSYKSVDRINFTTQTAPTVTAQLILYEGSNYIEIHNNSVQNWAGPNPAPERTTQGIENIGHSPGYPAPGRNNSTWTATRDAYRWRPITTNVRFSWTGGPLNDSTLGGPHGQAAYFTLVLPDRG